MHPEPVSGCLRIFSLGLGNNWARLVDEQGDSGGGGDQLMQQLQPLRHEFCIPDSHAGEIAARSIQAGNKAKLNRVPGNAENDRNRRGRNFRRNRS